MSDPLNIIGEEVFISDQLMAEELWLHIANGSSFGGMARLDNDAHSQEELQFDDNINAGKVGNGNTTSPIEDNFESLNGIIDIDDALERANQFFSELQTAILERKELKGDPNDRTTPDTASEMENHQQDLRRPDIGKVERHKTGHAQSSRTRVAPYPQQRLKSRPVNIVDGEESALDKADQMEQQAQGSNQPTLPREMGNPNAGPTYDHRRTKWRPLKTCRKCDPEKADDTEKRQGAHYCVRCQEMARLRYMAEREEMEKRIAIGMRQGEAKRGILSMTPPRSPSVIPVQTMAEVAPISPNSPLPIQDRKCFFIQRDYSKGLTVAWSTEFPTELVRVIDERSWVSFIKELNERFAIADKITFRSVMETFLGLCTCYIFHPCTRSSYEIHLEDISDYIDDVNEQIFNSRGINVCNPMEHGMRAIEVSFLFTQKEKPSHQPATFNNLGIIPRI